MHTDISSERVLAMLSTALGSFAGNLLLDPEVIEVMLNEDGKLWVDRLDAGLKFSGRELRPEDAERVIFIVASSIKTVCNQERPLLSAELPGIKARFQGVLPPLSQSPIFSIRKKAIKIFTLSDYTRSNIMCRNHAERILRAVQKRENVVVVGGTGSGKTTLINALLAEVAKTNDRLLIIEDTPELQCSAQNVVRLYSKEGVADMTQLLRASLRLRPDRIVIGELRGPEALTFLKACNTGHPGSCVTIHADSARKALSRMEQLVLEAGFSNSKQLIGEAIDLIVFIERTSYGRRVSEVLEVDIDDDGDYIFRLIPPVPGQPPVEDVD